MFLIKLSKEGDVTTAIMSGVLDDAVNFKELAAVSGRLVLDCRGVKRLNSVGIKNWVQFFQRAVKSGTSLEFVAVSPAMVEQFNIFKNFGCGGRVLSLDLPFVCPKCNHEFLEVATVDALRAASFVIADRKCPKCAANGTFDDYPEDYFLFLMKS